VSSNQPGTSITFHGHYVRAYARLRRQGVKHSLALQCAQAEYKRIQLELVPYRQTTGPIPAVRPTSQPLYQPQPQVPTINNDVLSAETMKISDETRRDALEEMRLHAAAKRTFDETSYNAYMQRHTPMSSLQRLPTNVLGYVKGLTNKSRKES
jgi:hypothetical protein